MQTGNKKSKNSDQGGAPIMHYAVITGDFPPDRFEAVKRRVLERGDRRTYRNLDNHSPHLRCGDVDLFLSPSTRQRNINCDPRLSDFNEIVIRPLVDAVIQYYDVCLVRPGDRENPLIYVPAEWEENNVYLRDRQAADIAPVRARFVKDYLPLLLSLVR
jgi:hypothetical protein